MKKKFLLNSLSSHGGDDGSMRKTMESFSLIKQDILEMLLPPILRVQEKGFHHLLSHLPEEHLASP